MKPTQPIVIDGKSYDHYAWTLTVSGRYEFPDTPDASVVLRLTPIRFEGEQIEAAAAESKTILFGCLQVADPNARVAAAEVFAAIQKYVNAEGL
jgi:hypothetical protein